jgi:hypothetical protein
LILDEHQSGKHFRVFCTDRDAAGYDCVGEYDSVEEVLSHKLVQNRRYQICVGNKFLTLKEFDAWSREDKEESRVWRERAVSNRQMRKPAQYRGSVFG